jgi:hypothetical protein
MSDTPELRIAAIPPTGAAEPVQHAHGVRDGAAAHPAQPAPAPVEQDVSASTNGQLQNAYAQFVIDPHTHDVVVRIRDAATDRILTELPSPEVQAVSRNLRDYAELLARRAAMQQAHNA